MASARAALRVALVVKKAAGVPLAEARQNSGWCEGTDARFFSSSQRSLPVAIDAGSWHAFFYEFLEHFCFGIQYLRIPMLNNINSYEFFGPIKL